MAGRTHLSRGGGGGLPVGGEGALSAVTDGPSLVLLTGASIEFTPSPFGVVGIGSGTEYPYCGTGGDLNSRILTPAQMLLTGAGANSGLAMSAGNTYYVYVSDSLATYAPLEVRASDSSPSRGAGTDGVYYLATSGNGAHWRFLGVVRYYGDSTFKDEPSNRGIRNYYHRRYKPLYVCPGYADGNTETTYTADIPAGGAWNQIHASAAVTWVDYGIGSYAEPDDGVELGAHVAGNTGTNTLQVGIAIGSEILCASQRFAAGVDFDTHLGRNVRVVDGLSIATFYTAKLMGMRLVGANDVTIIADWERNGATKDPPCTILYGGIWG